jgi:hypothetical protein
VTVQQDRTLAMLSPMWQRIARGEVDLSLYTDDEILSAEIRMADGRLLPAPAVLPDLFIREQIKRGLRKAERSIRKGALTAIEVYEEILEDDMCEPKDRMTAAKFFTDRFLGKPDQHVHHHAADLDDAREVLIQRLLAARSGLPAAAALQIASGQEPDDIMDAELVDDATIALEDLL